MSSPIAHSILPLLAGLALLAAPASGQCTPPLLDFENGLDSVQSLAQAGGFVLVGNGIDGLATVDVSSPTSMQIVSSFSTQGSCGGVVVDGDVAYARVNSSELVAIDVSDPAVPVELGRISLPGLIQGFAVSSGIAYLGVGGGGLVGLEILDVSDPSSMSSISSFPSSFGFVDIAALDGRIYSASGTAGLQILDVSDPAAPSLVGSVQSPGPATDILVQDGLAYLAAAGFGLQIVDVSDPTAPQEVGSYPTPSQPTSLEVSDHLVFVGTNGSGILIVEVVDPTAPMLVGTASTLGGNSDLALLGGTLFSGNLDAGLRSYGVASCLQPLGFPYCGPAPLNSTSQSARVIGLGSILASDNDLRLYAVDMPAGKASYVIASQTQGFVPMPGGSQGNLCLGGQIARLADGVLLSDPYGSALFTVDLTNIPTSPPQAVQSGQTWNFQVWYRDQNPGNTSNFSDALSVSFF